METTLTTNEFSQHAQPIPGYVLDECIGSGGNGEVWRATAPGGLPKAVKVVYGNFEDDRATRELRSLNRVKELHHPFLLSLERIEIVGGRLLIVTELADSSLRDRYAECRRHGGDGIGQEELMMYLRETADALDYLYQRQSLQHLDVKPENLLLACGHIKVADFGLLKDLQEGAASLVTGFTPRYAAPEVFDGKPCRHSDQYSLAIVYQEMLTGKLPFDGRSPAQLASQHLHCPPDLSSLPAMERFAVGKALSKDPQRRFDSCLEFVERLTHRSKAKIIMEGADSSSKKSDTDPQTGPQTGSQTGPQIGPQTGSRTGTHAGPSTIDEIGVGHDGNTIVVTAPEIKSLPALRIDADNIQYRPSIFIGVGGMGGQILCLLKQLLADRFGDLTNIPALQFLYVDTDIQSINQITSADNQCGLADHETLCLPLRQTRDYRAEDLCSLKSVSRRWIYNVPRSLRTEGLRALGRLALVDHSRRVLERLRKTILEAIEVHSPKAASTAPAAPLEFQDGNPRVYVVASITGGSGGGMVVDLGYALRQILAEFGLPDDDLCAILMYAAAKNQTLAPANAYVCLDELRHFSLPGHDYPGEPSRGLAGFREDGATFKSTYLVDLGDDLTGEQLRQAHATIAEYLLLGAVTPAGLFFDQCRQSDGANAANANPASASAASGDFFVRSFGLINTGAENTQIPNTWVETLCKRLARKWRGGVEAAKSGDRIKLSEVERIFDGPASKTAISPRLQSLALQKVDQLHLHPERIAAAMETMIQDEVGAPWSSYQETLLAQSMKKSLANKTDLLTDALQILRSVIGVTDDAAHDHDLPMESLRERVLSKLPGFSRLFGAPLESWILDFVNTADGRVDAARHIACWLSDYVDTLHREAILRRKKLESELEQRVAALTQLREDRNYKRPSNKALLTDRLSQYSNLLYDDLITEGVCKTLNGIQSFITSACDRLRDLWKDLNQLADLFDAVEECVTGPESLTAHYNDQEEELVEQIDREMQKSFFAHQRLPDVIAQGHDARLALMNHMRSAARRVILRRNQQANFQEITHTLNQDPAPGANDLMQRCVASSLPPLLKIGGGKRLFVVCPSTFDESTLRKHLQQFTTDQPTILRDVQSNFAVGYEVQELEFTRLATTLIRRQPECEELAARLHARVDIDWTSR